MKRLMTVTLTALALSAGASPSLFAIDNICWRINGFPLQTALSFVGNADGASVYNVQGRGTSTAVPIAGTLVFPAAGNALLSFSIQAASPGQHAVMHQLSLNRATLGGTGNFRWFDSTNSGASTAVFVSCATVPRTTEDADRAAQGLE
jgi:hypothetical protein